MRGASWAVDYPGADYHFSRAVKRLTRIDAHPTGHIVSPDHDDLFDYPWTFAVEVGDLHGEHEWQVFTEGMQ